MTMQFLPNAMTMAVSKALALDMMPADVMGCPNS